MQRVELPRNHDGFRNHYVFIPAMPAKEIIGLEEVPVRQAVRLLVEPQQLRLADILVGKETISR